MKVQYLVLYSNLLVIANKYAQLGPELYEFLELFLNDVLLIGLYSSTIVLSTRSHFQRLGWALFIPSQSPLNT